MKAFKTSVSLILALALIFVPVMSTASAAETEKSVFGDGEGLNFLVLGDSISEGFGVENNDEAGYARIVADTEGYDYLNYSRVATDTSDLISRLESKEEIINAVKEADIINLSIGSNNYLANDDVVMITVGALFGTNDKQLDEIAQWIFEDYLKIIDKLRALNPDAVLIFDNVYCSWEGLGRIPFNKAVVRVNAALDKAKEARPGEFEIFDLASVINGHGELVADDSTHPNAKGNVEIARAMLLFLKELGLGEKTEPVVNHEGIDYNYFQQSFGTVAGALITVIVKWLTKHY
ncbi:MAG: hypothetical protein IKS39_01075 [Clostridia bacterium]|nr:hypothetical protein [Clostridia bacterium]